MFIKLTHSSTSNPFLIRVEDIIFITQDDVDTSVVFTTIPHDSTYIKGGVGKVFKVSDPVDEIHKRIRESQNGFPL